MIEVQGLTKSYGSVAAVRDLSFSVAPGEVLGLVGPNGAGKTTTLRSLAGIVRAAGGRGRPELPPAAPRRGDLHARPHPASRTQGGAGNDRGDADRAARPAGAEPRGHFPDAHRDMIGAALYLVGRSLLNATRRRVARLRQPKYLIGLVVGGLYFYSFFFRPRRGAGLGAIASPGGA